MARHLAEASGAEIRLRGDGVTRIDRRPDRGVAVLTASGDVVRGPGAGELRRAALRRDRAASRVTSPAPASCPSAGEYYELARPELVRGLVYPVPDPAFPFLGVHLTRGVDGGVHVGAPTRCRPWPARGYDRRTVRPRELAATLAWPGSWRLARRHWRYGAGRAAPLAVQARLHPGGAPAPARRARRGPGADGRPGCARRRCCATAALVDDFLIRERAPSGARAERPLARRDRVPADRAGRSPAGRWPELAAQGA
ncbi:hypothetical protein GCM10019016_060620 [Streptomyces prasinosporus]|uniref:FAD dependent oxidoreductase domain-containing protein n=1 Tax=Streptomyces prasinosporus TaxID=68256 RepID=A0ABP6TV10_9ACTN